MEQVLNIITQYAVEIIVVIIGYLAMSIDYKVREYVDRLKKKDELGIVDAITDAAVEWAEAELKGKTGIEKRDFAVKKAVEILSSKGIKVSEAEIIAGIENGVNKLRLKQQKGSSTQITQNAHEIQMRAMSKPDGLSDMF